MAQQVKVLAESLTARGNVQSERKEEKPLLLSMPIIAEEEEETDFGEAEFTAPKRRRKR